MLLFNSNYNAAPSGGAGTAYVGEAYNISTTPTVHTLDYASPNQGTALPATFASGTFLVFSHTSVAPTSLVMDGTTAPLVDQRVASNMTVTAYEVTISGGGTGTIVLTLPSGGYAAVSVYNVTGLTRITSLDIYRQISNVNFPTNTDGTTTLTTLAGDVYITAITSTDSAYSSWTGLTETMPKLTIGARYAGSAWNTNCTGGSPETLNVVLSATFKYTSVVSLIYR